MPSFARVIFGRIGTSAMRRLVCPIIELALLCCAALWTCGTASAQWAPRNPVNSFQQQPDGVLFTMKNGTLKVQVCSDSIIRVRYSATSSFADLPNYVVIKTSWPETRWTMQTTAD